MTTTRRKYQFPSREAAEQACQDARHECTMKHFAIIALMNDKVDAKFRNGTCRVSLVYHHAHTGRELSCPVVIVTEGSGTHPNVSIEDAYKWCDYQINRSLSFVCAELDNEILAMRELAESVKRKMKELSAA